MTIVYSCIARGTTVLCSHQIGAGNYEQAAEQVLANLPTRNDGKTTIASASCKYHCMVENGIIFVCAAAPDFPARSCFGYLTEIKDQFHNDNFATRAVMAREHEFDTEFNSVMVKQMEKFSKPEEGNDNISALQSQVHEVKGVMAQNIEKVIQRGERLDDLVDKTDELNAASATFQKTATRIKKKYWWRNTKMKIIIAIIVFVVIVGIVFAILGGLGVFNKDSKTTNAPATTTQKP